ncbi:hypothetical protein [Streptomyces sp.]|uniref:hypothetical protein n=1 Tax=Streptomyces sp. TaxID=1931 RepID=UPI002811F191|nr:hypothetical protein [Streptomyces sp.]
MDDAAQQPYIDPDSDHEDRPVCGICPSLRFPRDQFVIYDRPSWEAPFDPVDGRRYTLDGRIPACVHPDKIGLPADRQAPPPRPLETEPAGQSATPRRSRWWRPSRAR